MKSKLLFVLLVIISPLFSSGQNFDSRNDWMGKYVGNASAIPRSMESYYGNHPRFECSINLRDKFYVNPGTGAGYYVCTISLPTNYREIHGLQITKTTLKHSPTRRYPFELDLKKSTDKYGDTEITGTIAYYKVQQNGELTLGIKLYAISLYPK